MSRSASDVLSAALAEAEQVRAQAWAAGHAEGHAAALMRQNGISEATLYINNPNICAPCTKYLPEMLPAGSTLNIVLPDGRVVQFKGIAP